MKRQSVLKQINKTKHKVNMGKMKLFFSFRTDICFFLTFLNILLTVPFMAVYAESGNPVDPDIEDYFSLLDIDKSIYISSSIMSATAPSLRCSDVEPDNLVLNLNINGEVILDSDNFYNGALDCDFTFKQDLTATDRDSQLVFTMVGMESAYFYVGPITPGTPMGPCPFDITIEEFVPCRMQDSLALVALYNSTDGANWNTTWDLNSSIDTWYGVTLNTDGCVECLDLDGDAGCNASGTTGNNLIGTLPPELGNLTNLEWLYLHNNGLTGTIPLGLGNLTNLEELSLFNNGLTGTIPLELGNLTNLEELWLNDNGLTGTIPLELGSLTNLERLRLHNNGLTGTIPLGLGNLTNLEELSLFNNGLTGTIPLELGNLTNLERLSLYHNGLTGTIPLELGNLTNLKSLLLFNNELIGTIPLELGNLTNLEVLWLSNNGLTGTIPLELGNLTNLEWLYLQNNQLEGCFPIELNTHCGLSYNPNPSPTNGYNFDNNPALSWSGDFERFCNNDPQIGATCDDSNPATIDDKIQADCSCRGINMCRESDSTALVALYNSTDGANWINTWDLSQPIDTWYGVRLNADGCVECLDLDGTVNCGGRNALDSGNELSGYIPLGFDSLLYLERLDLSNNSIDSTIFDFYFPKLKLLELSDNQLIGPIPNFTGIDSLTELYLGTNNFDNLLPNFSSLSELTILEANRANFNGIIPDLSALTKIEKIDLDQNNFIGDIPDFVFPSLTTLSIGAMNPATGSLNSDLPDLSGCPNLEFLDFRNNNITGTIPVHYGDLTNLKTVTLGANHLEGMIPASFSQLINIETLRLGQNKLEGEIPVGIYSLPSLEDFELRENNLQGCWPNEALNLCPMGFDNSPSGDGYDLTNNPALPWSGDFQRFCNNDPQIGAPCDDSNPATTDDKIQADCSCRGTNMCRQSDSLALVALYNSAGGSNWTYTSGDYFTGFSFRLVPNSGNPWDFSTPISTWHGVGLNSDGCVEVLALNDNNLSGSLTDLNFSGLKDFTCGSNFLTGSIPDLEQAPLLEIFNCASNSFTGTIPEFDQIPSLKVFFCGTNSLSGSIPVLDRVPLLEDFSCANNSLSGSIPAFDPVPLLKSFICWGNQLTGLLPDFDSVPLLEDFYCYDNQIQGSISPSIGNLTNLRRFYIHNNNIEGCYPTEVNSLCPIGFTNDIGQPGYNLTGNLDLPWSGDFERFCNNEPQIGAPCDDSNPATVDDKIQADCGCRGINMCRQNDSLSLVALYNSTDGANWTNTWDLNSSIDTWYGVRLNGDGCVECLDLDGDANCNTKSSGGNNLVGLIPPELGELANLEVLSLGVNELTGLIPPELGELANLEVLWLGANELTGIIPPELGELANLEVLWLNGTALTGIIPPELGELSNLESLLLSNNELTGLIPPELGELSNLTWLVLSDNELTGIIPPELGELSNLMWLLLSDNELTGLIPPELGELSNLTWLVLSDNELEGCFPNELIVHCGLGFNFQNNPALPWSGDFQRFCTMEPQIGATCNDGDANTQIDVIQADCTCRGCPFNMTDVNDTLCPEDNQLINNNTYDINTPQGQEIITLTTGCDSVVNVDLQFYMPAMATLADSYCQGSSYTLPDNRQVSTPGQYTAILFDRSQNGCDSTITINLTESTALSSTQSAQICEGANYTLPDGMLVTAEGDYNSTLITVAGCDSVVTTSLSYYPQASRSFSATYCQGSSYTLPDNSQVSTPGQYTVRLANIAPNGCDSILTVNLSELTAYNFTNSASICNGETYQLPDGRSVNTSNTYTSTLQTAAGCDSIIMTALTVFPPIIPITETAVICEGATYNWNGQTYQNEGNYAVTLQNNSGCDSTIQLNLSVEGVTTLGAADAGADISVCEDMVDLFANDLPNTFGNWLVPNGVSVQPQNQGGAVASNLEEGQNTFIWTLSGANCADFDRDTVVVNYAASGPRLIQDNVKLDTGFNKIDLLSNDDLNGISDFTFDLLDIPRGIENWRFDNATNQLELDMTVRGLMSLDYSICYTACPDVCDTSFVEIFVDGYPDEGEVNIIITPKNQDGLNDVLIFDDLDEYPNNTLYIYNRWGNMVYSAAPYKNDWDGKRGRKKKPLPEGTYYYVMRKQLPDKIKYGSITIKY